MRSPNCSVAVLADQQRRVMRDADRAAPDAAVADHKPGGAVKNHPVAVAADGAAAGSARRYGPPKTFIAAIFGSP
jgi:hypothetical protein